MKNEILQKIKEHPNYLSELSFKNHFPNEYIKIVEINFPENFLFKQKVYHWIYDDYNLKLGICKECGSRCNFRNFNYGYNEYCCSKCSNNSEKKKNDIKNTIFKHYGVYCSSKSELVKNKAKQTNLERYGFGNPMQNKIIQEKAKQTNLEKYGTENVFASEYGKNKIKQTNLERYGFENPMQNKIIQEKKKETNLKRYDVDNPLKNKEIRNKIKKTCFEKYGVTNPFYSNEIQNNIKNENLVKYGVEYPFQSNEIQDKSRKTFLKKYGRQNFRFSNIESEIISYIKEIYDGNILENNRSVLDGKEIDIYLPKLSIGFEINGDYWHMNPMIYNEKSFNKVIGKYAYEIWERDENKIKYARDKNIVLYVIWEQDWRNKRTDVKNFIKNIIFK